MNVTKLIMSRGCLWKRNIATSPMRRAAQTSGCCAVHMSLSKQRKMDVWGRTKQNAREKFITKSFIIRNTFYQIFMARLAEHVAWQERGEADIEFGSKSLKGPAGGACEYVSEPSDSVKGGKRLFVFRKNVILWIQVQLRLVFDRHEQNYTSKFNAELGYETSQKHRDRLTRRHLWEEVLPLRATNMKRLVVRFAMPCNLTQVHRRLGETYGLRLQGRRANQVSKQ